MIKKFSRELGAIAVLAVIMVVLGVIRPIYFSPSNLLDILDRSITNGLLAIGMTLVVIAAGIDLTVGFTLAIVIVSVSNFLVMGLSPFVAVLAGAAIGFCLGLMNEVLVAKMKLQPFVVTLGVMFVYRGVAYFIVGGWPTLNIPQNFRDIMDSGIIDTLSSLMILFLVVMVVTYILLKHTKFGTYLCSIGSNREATRLSGVNVDFDKIMSYAICGVCVAFAGMVMLAKLNTGEPAAGANYGTNAVVAAAIGGTGLAGGKGSIIGTFLGAILLQALKVGLVVCDVDTFWQYIATGLIMVFVVYMDVIQGKLAAMGLNEKTEAEQPYKGVWTVGGCGGDHIYIIGSPNYDIIMGQKRMPLLGEAYTANNMTCSGGGEGASQTVQCVKLGIGTIMVGKVGRDAFDDTLVDKLKDYRANRSCIGKNNNPAGVGVVHALEDGTVHAPVITGANFDITSREIDGLDKLVRSSRIIILQLGIFTDVVEHIIRKAKQYHIYTILNAAPTKEMNREVLRMVDCLTINETEASFCAGAGMAGGGMVRTHADRLRQLTDGAIIVTLGPKGSVLLGEEGAVLIDPVEVERVAGNTGAGDPYIGAFAYERFRGMTDLQACYFTARTVSVIVTKIEVQGTMPYLSGMNESRLSDV